MKPDYMRNEIEEIPKVLQRILKKTYELFDLGNEFDEFWITGSGDSHCAALYGSYLFNNLGIRAKAFYPFELSQLIQFNIKNPCLIAISVSGKTPRVIESIRRFKKKYSQNPIIGITDNPFSPLYDEVTHKILISASPPETLIAKPNEKEAIRQYDGYQHPIPQTKTYFANVVWLTILGFKLVGKLNDVTKMLNNLESNLANWIAKAYQISKQHRIQWPKKTIFLGSGLFYSLAQFGAYKWYEFTYPCLYQDIEEYAHTQYFVTDKNTSIVIFSPNTVQFGRIIEILSGALLPLLRPDIHLIITKNLIQEMEKDEIIKIYPVQLDLQETNYEEIAFYLYSLIIVFWRMYSTARLEGFDTNRFRGGKDVEKYVKGSLSTIRGSKIKE